MEQIDNKKTSKALFKNTGIIAIGQISTKIVNFLLLPLYTALLTTEEYGLVDLLTTYANFIAVLVGLQMSQAVFRFLVTTRDNGIKTKEITTTVTFASILACFGYAVLFFIVSPFIVLEYKWYLLLHVFSTIYLQTTSGIARGYGNNIDFSIANFLSASITITLNVVFLAVLHFGVDSMLLAYIIGPIVGGTFLIYKSKIYKNISISYFNKNDLRRVLSYSIPLVPNELSWSVIHASDRMIVSAFLTVAANGLIAVASKFSVIYTTAFSIFNTSWTEQVVLHYKDKGGVAYINDMFGKMVTFFATLAIGIIAVMPFVFDFLVNANFSESYNLIPIYMLAVFFNAVIGLLSAIYLIENETKQVAISTIIAAVINVVVDLFLIKVIGVYAAPISSLCGYGFISIWRFRDVNVRHCKIIMPTIRIIELLFMMVLSLISYYSHILWVQVGLLLAIVCIAFLVNYTFLKELVSVFVKKKDK